MAYYEESIREAVEQRDNDDSGNLMPYFDEDRNPSVRKKVLNAVPTVEIRDGELMGCTTVKLKEPLTEAEMQDLQDYLKGQFSDGWGEGFEQQEIQTGDGVLYGNIFAILGRASRLLKENGQPQQAKEMSSRVYQSGDYYKALNIISEYVETELSEKVPPKQKKRSDRER